MHFGLVGMPLAEAATGSVGGKRGAVYRSPCSELAWALRGFKDRRLGREGRGGFPVTGSSWGPRGSWYPRAPGDVGSEVSCALWGAPGDGAAAPLGLPEICQSPCSLVCGPRG